MLPSRRTPNPKTKTPRTRRKSRKSRKLRKSRKSRKSKLFNRSVRCSKRDKAPCPACKNCVYNFKQ